MHIITNIPSITIGRITALWRVLKVVEKYSNIGKSDLLQISSNTSLRGGGLPINDGLELAEFGGFIEIKGDIVKITSLGNEIVSLWNKDEPNSLVIRKILLPLVLKIMPPWIVFSSKPLAERIYAIPERWKEVLKDAELLADPLSGDAFEWWTSLQNTVMEEDEQNRKKVGEVGEKLTIKFEKERLLKEKHSNLSERIKWVSKISDKCGFDILSFFGLLKSDQRKSNDELRIEVKSSTSSSNNSFRFFLTRHEWENAEKNRENYFFYLWKNIKISDGTGDGPIILPVNFIMKYIPIDKNEKGKWSECRIDLNFKEMKDNNISK